VTVAFFLSFGVFPCLLAPTPFSPSVLINISAFFLGRFPDGTVDDQTA